MRVNNDELIFDLDPHSKSLPKPSFDLTESQKKFYERYGRELHKAGKIKNRDSISLTMLAISLDEYMQCEMKIREIGFITGVVQVFTSGATNVSGYVSARSNAFKEVSRLSKSLGLSIRDRKEIDRIGNDNQGELFGDALVNYGKDRDAV